MVITYNSEHKKTIIDFVFGRTIKGEDYTVFFSSITNRRKLVYKKELIAEEV